jgi:hypothetical protein
MDNMCYCISHHREMESLNSLYYIDWLWLSVYGNSFEQGFRLREGNQSLPPAPGDNER